MKKNTKMLSDSPNPDLITTNLPWQTIKRFPEIRTLCIALCCISAIFIWYGTLYHSNPVKANNMWEIIGKHIIGGAAIGALTGAPSLSKVVTNPTIPPEKILEMPTLIEAETGTLPGAPYATEFTTMENIILNSLISISLIFLVFGFFSLSCRKIFRIKMLDKTFAEMESNASGQRKKWARWGIPGVFIFVWIPLTGTGPIIGAILGKVIGLPYWTNLLTVSTASISSLTAWAFFAQAINQWFGNKWLNIISNIFISVVIFGIIFAKIGGWIKKRLAKKES